MKRYSFWVIRVSSVIPEVRERFSVDLWKSGGQKELYYISRYIGIENDLFYIYSLHLSNAILPFETGFPFFQLSFTRHEKCRVLNVWFNKRMINVSRINTYTN